MEIQIISFYFINVETIGKYENVKKSHLKNFTSPATEILLSRNKESLEMVKKKIGKKYTSPANELLLHLVEAVGNMKKISYEKNECPFHKCRNNRRIRKCKKKFHN